MHEWGPQSVEELRERVKEFNEGLQSGMQAGRWKSWVGSGKYFVFDGTTGTFGMNKFVGYCLIVFEGKTYRHCDLNEYAHIASPPGDRSRYSSPIDGSEAKKYIEENLGLSYQPFQYLEHAQQEKVRLAFTKWYCRHFAIGPSAANQKAAQAKCAKSSFVII